MAGDMPVWLPAPEPSSPDWTLAPGAVHVWLAPLDADAAALDRMATLLSDDERQRVQRFAFQRDHAPYIATRATLRALLAAYLGVPTTAFAFAYGPNGKPSLAPPYAASNLHFNTSHSRDYALVAVARERAVGVDIEYMRPQPRAARLAERFFSPYEFGVWQGLPPERQHDAFYACWTRKEAFVKATGKGLTQILTEFDVTLDPDAPARLLRIAGDDEAAARWSLASLPAPTGYVAALALDGAASSLALFRWQP